MVMRIKWRLFMQAWIYKNTIKKIQLKLLVFLVCLVPLLRLIALAYSDQLSANPIEFITRSTGTWALVFLCITLSVTPIRQITSYNKIIKLRRMFGLFCFFYAFLHFCIWIWIDNGFEWHEIIADFYKRTFITLGLIAFTLLIPLALSSSKKSQKWLGRKWALLHRLTYIIAILVLLHFWIHKAGKNDFSTVNIYIAIVSVLFIWRIYKKLSHSFKR